MREDRYPKIGSHPQSNFAMPDRDEGTWNARRGCPEGYHPDPEPQLLKQTVPRTVHA